MDIIDVTILSVVEGVTEFLPISSTAHLILTSHLLKIPPTEFLTTFEIAIQLGAILAVAVMYAKKIFSNFQLLAKACVAFIPTGILGFIFFDHIKLLFNSTFVPVAALFIGGVFIILIEIYLKKTFVSRHIKTKVIEDLRYKDAFLIGLIQSISMIPGVSRAAASIFGGMALHLDRRSAVEFSFLLALPTMTAATTLDLLKSSNTFTTNQTLLLILGIFFSFITALIVIKWLVKFVQTNDFIIFGIYRIVASVVYYIFFIR